MNALFAAILGAAIAMMVMSSLALRPRTTAYRIGCKTNGATLLHKTTKDDKYLTFYCVKNGVVVP